MKNKWLVIGMFFCAIAQGIISCVITLKTTDDAVKTTFESMEKLEKPQ